MAQTTALPPRSEIPLEYTWNATSVYESEADWRAELEATGASISDIEKFQGKLGDSPATLAEALHTMENLQRRVSNFQPVPKVPGTFLC